MSGQGCLFNAKTRQLCKSGSAIRWAKRAFGILVASVIALTAISAQQVAPNSRKAVDRLSDLMRAPKVAADGVSLQRYVLTSQTEVIRLAPGKTSALLKGFCLDQDLPAPGASRTLYKFVHTRGVLAVAVGSKAAITFDEALGARSGIAPVVAVHATSSSEGECATDGCYYLQFENISSSNLSIKVPRTLVFGRSDGWLDEQNPREAQLLRILNEPSLTNRKVWEATARLARLRMLGFWPQGVALDAVTSEVQTQAEALAQKALRIRAEDLDRSLASIFKLLTPRGTPVDELFPEYSANDAVRGELPYVVRIRATAPGFVRIKGVAVSEARIHGSLSQFVAIFNSEVSMLDYSETGYEIELRPQPPAPSGPRFPPPPPDGGSGGGSTRGTRVDLNPNDFMSLLKKATAEGCSLEYCVTRPATTGSIPGQAASSGDQQVLIECGNWGFGLSTSGKVELKVGPVSVEGP